MELNNHDQARIREYLLGQLSEDEEQRIEERLMIEDDLFEEFEASKGELVEDYCAGELSQNEHQWFEQYFLASPEGKQKHTFAVALGCLKRPSLSPAPAPLTLFQRFENLLRTQRWAIVRASAAVLIVVGVAFVASRMVQPPKTIASLNLFNTQQKRGDGPAVSSIPLPSNAKELKVSLALPSSAPSAPGYSAELLNGAGETIPVQILSHDSHTVVVAIPAAQLPRGQYNLRLYAKTADGQETRIPGNYFFDIQ